MVLPDEVVGDFWAELEVTPAMQVHALLILELDDEHADRNCGRDEVAAATFVVYVAQNTDAEAVFPLKALR